MGIELRKLHARHRHILRLHALGWRNVDIANEVGMTPQAIGVVVNSEIGQMVIQDMQTQLDREALDVQGQLTRNALISEQFLGRIVDGSEPANVGLRAKVCMDQLDRAGFPKAVKSINLDLHGRITAEEIQEIKEQARRLSNVVEPKEAFVELTADPSPQPPIEEKDETGSYVD